MCLFPFSATHEASFSYIEFQNCSSGSQDIPRDSNFLILSSSSVPFLYFARCFRIHRESVSFPIPDPMPARPLSHFFCNLSNAMFHASFRGCHDIPSSLSISILRFSSFPLLYFILWILIHETSLANASGTSTSPCRS